MIRDEYNQIEVKNDQQTLKVEYGKTQKIEFSSQKENKLPEGDLNEKYVGKTIKKTADVNVDYVNKVPVHGTQTVATSTASASATAAATTASSVVAVASTVAITAVAVATGISVAIHDYQYKFSSLIISSNELRYELLVYDKKDEDSEYLSYETTLDVAPRCANDVEDADAPFTLRVYNDNYDSKQYIWAKEYNSGVFEHLELGDSYTIVLSENRYGGEVIYKDTFTTFVNSSFIDFDIPGSADVEQSTFDVYVDFIDDKDIYSDFKVEFYDPNFMDETYATVNLEKQRGFQTVSVLNEQDYPMIELDQEWAYKFSYVEDGTEVNFKEGLVNFYDAQGRESKFNSFIFDKTANFIKNTIDVRLDYTDYFNWFTEFNLKLTAISEDGGQSYYEEYVIPLEVTTETQTIEMDVYDISVTSEYYKYTYVLEGVFRGELMTLASEEEPFQFTDNSGAVSKFNEFIFDKTANFITNSIDVRIDYQDDFGYFSAFTFKLTTVTQDGGEYYYDDTLIPLQLTTETQTIELEQYDINAAAEYYQFIYALEGVYRGETITYASVSEPFSFTDNSNGKSEFTSFIFDKTADFTAMTFDVQLDYVDDYSYYYGFRLTLYPVGVNAQYDFSLNETAEVQTLEIDPDYAHYLFSFDYEFTYTLNVYFKGEDIELDSDDTPFKFTDSLGRKSEFDHIVFDGTYDMGSGEVPVQLVYQDDFNYFTKFTLTLYGGMSADDYFEIELDPVTTVQYFNAYDNDIPTSEVQYTYSLSCIYKGEEKPLLNNQGPITFNDPDAASEVHNVVLSGFANFINRSFYVHLDYEDDFDIFDDFVLIVNDTTNGGSVTRPLNKTTEDQLITIDEMDTRDDGYGGTEYYYPVDIVNGTITYNLTYMSYTSDDQESHQLYATDQEWSFNNSLESDFRGLESPFDFTGTAGEELNLAFRYDVVNTAELISNLEFLILDDQDDILAQVFYANEVVRSEWQLGSLDLINIGIDELTNGTKYRVVIRGILKDERTEDVDDQHIFYDEEHAFTLNSVTQIYGISLYEYVTAGDYQAGLELFYGGDPEMFSDVEFILEGNTATYTYEIDVERYPTVTVLYPNEGALTEDEFEAFLNEGPVDVYIRYRVVDSSSPTGYSEQYTLLCYEDFVMWVSHQFTNVI